MPFKEIDNSKREKGRWHGVGWDVCEAKSMGLLQKELRIKNVMYGLMSDSGT